MAREEPTKYEQIAGELRARIKSGEFPPGSRLPSKAYLMEHYSASLGTVNHAVDILRAEGLAETVQGVATFAREPADRPLSEYETAMKRIEEVAEEVRRLGERLTDVEQQNRS